MACINSHRRQYRRLPLVFAIERRGLTIQETARLCGLRAASLSRIINGRSRPMLGTAQRLSRVLDVPVDVLFPPETFNLAHGDDR